MKKKLQKVLENPALTKSERKLLRQCVEEAIDLEIVVRYLKRPYCDLPYSWSDYKDKWTGYIEFNPDFGGLSYSAIRSWESGWPRFTPKIRKALLDELDA